MRKTTLHLYTNYAVMSRCWPLYIISLVTGLTVECMHGLTTSHCTAIHTIYTFDKVLRNLYVMKSFYYNYLDSFCWYNIAVELESACTEFVQERARLQVSLKYRQL